MYWDEEENEEVEILVVVWVGYGGNRNGFGVRMKYSWVVVGCNREVGGGGHPVTVCVW